MLNSISIKHAKEHNLKNISLDLPRNKFIVVTGLSGSGKSSLAFDTIYAEGQRRYVESLSAYARQFLDQMQKPDVESIEGLSPTISIEQKTTSRNPRSTVATQTEIYDYLRLLFARVGVPYYKGQKLEKQSAQEMSARLLKLPEGTKISLLAPMVRGKKGVYPDIQKQVSKAGFARLRVDGNIYDVNEKFKLDRYKVHHIEIVVDRLSIKPDIKGRLTDSVETALKVGKGVLIAAFSDGQPDLVFSETFSVPDEDINLPELEPRTFSFNSPYGACPDCNGLGTKMEIDPEALVKDPAKPWTTAIVPAGKGRRAYMMHFRAAMRELGRLYDIDPSTPFNKLPKGFKKSVIDGSDDIVWGKKFEGVKGYLERIFRSTDSDWLKEEITDFMSEASCPACGGLRLKKETLMVLVGERNIAEVTAFSIKDARTFFNRLELPADKKPIAAPIIKEVNRRLDFCIDVGLEYLTLDRRSSTLSGGEAERIRLATQVGSGLVGVVYVLDEPSIGLHQRDNERLLSSLHTLRDMGNTLIVVEHDEDTIRKADWVVDLGPGAGKFGGEVLYAGEVDGLLKCPGSLTGQYLRRELFIETPVRRRDNSKAGAITIKGVTEHNLKNIDVSIPLGKFVCVTGVSGSGKSTLVENVLHKALAQKFYGARDKPGAFRKIEGLENIDKVIVVDQSPIGRTPRSNPATYTGVFTDVRQLFARLPEARLRGYDPGRFSFNVKGGRCEACEGDGIKEIEMHFLPDVHVECEVCHGRRFNEQTLQVEFKDRNISQVLDCSILEALQVFEGVPRIRRVLEVLNDVGLEYIKLGQAATTLSGGEAQRVKLATELCKQATGRTLYILDEPTTGLHFADVAKLLKVLQRLVDRGNTVLVIEHNLDVIKSADHIIDLGPEGGDKGGELVCCGTPEEVARHPSSYTAQYLKPFLNNLSFLPS
ncbi:MAG: excinuclease ABC subunit UvrA [Candidatus Omnitrophica bacterium]|nr:excinuclease ABC subunit UvrA [Candidatus Omnitrophota bacterium]